MINTVCPQCKKDCRVRPKFCFFCSSPFPAIGTFEQAMANVEAEDRALAASGRKKNILELQHPCTPADHEGMARRIKYKIKRPEILYCHECGAKLPEV